MEETQLYFTNGGITMTKADWIALKVIITSIATIIVMIPILVTCKVMLLIMSIPDYLRWIKIQFVRIMIDLKETFKRR